MTKRRKRVLQGAVALVAAFVLVAWMTRDARLHHAMLGRWHCAPYFHSGEATLYFLDNGKYALFDGIKDPRYESGSWDVVGGELLQIEEQGSSGTTHRPVHLAWTTLVIGKSDNAICKRVDDDDD